MKTVTRWVPCAICDETGRELAEFFGTQPGIREVVCIGCSGRGGHELALPAEEVERAEASGSPLLWRAER